MQRRHLSVLGATGSIGLSTLDVVRRHPQRFSVYALTACSSVEAMAALCREFEPAIAVMADRPAAEKLRKVLVDLPQTNVLTGEAGLSEAATSPGVDTVMAAIVGAAGLPPTLAAVRAGKRVFTGQQRSASDVWALVYGRCGRIGRGIAAH